MSRGVTSPGSARSPLSVLVVAVAVAAWLVVGYLLLLEAHTAIEGSETEHSPFAVARVVAPVAVVASIAWYVLRRRGQQSR